MLHRFMKIIDHEVEDRLDLFFGVSRVVGKICILISQYCYIFLERAH